MRSPFLLALAACGALLVPSTAGAAAKPDRYLALGDSLSASWQPKAGGGGHVTTEGYAEDLAKTAKVKLVKYGCPGETTTSMIEGGKDCAGVPLPYRHSSAKTSQLAAAVSYLERNRKRVRFVTVSIGANDVASCAQGGGIDGPCLTAGLDAIKKNLPVIAKRLRAAAGPKVKLAIHTQYDPFLQYWLKGDDTSRGLAGASVLIARTSVNDAIAKGVRSARFRVADVAKEFDTYVPFEQTTTLDPYGTVPVAVAQICRLTWMCSGPNGPDIHANRVGYRVIAATFAKALGLR